METLQNSLNTTDSENGLLYQLGLTEERAKECFDWVLLSLFDDQLISDTLKKAVIADFNTTELVFICYITGIITQYSEEQRARLMLVAQMKKISQSEKTK